jgi:2-phospho-L-lactate transferase/gluconeogenesis factor (CofD/UPF0052 family)
METLNVTIHNVSTGEIQVVPMTEDEVALHLADREETAQMKAEAEAKKLARLALLDKLGITEEESKLLLS